jgi:hypothetical protein
LKEGFCRTRNAVDIMRTGLPGQGTIQVPHQHISNLMKKIRKSPNMDFPLARARMDELSFAFLANFFFKLF